MSDPLEQLIERARQRAGATLRRGKYRLERLLGVGAMGAVFAATHRNGMRVAIKIMHAELARMEDLRGRFLREGYIANKVQHPGLIRVLDDDVDDDGTTFLVMELLDGRTLAAEWEAAGCALPPWRVAAVVDAILDVLHAAHGQGVVHRDIKPENVFLPFEGGPKLLDLGIAQLLEARVTASGQMVGTPEFVSPEQASGRVNEIDGRTDIYSVGAMMFTLLTGRLVHEARTSIEAIVYAATRPARSLLEPWPDAPPTLAMVVDIALCFEKAKRWSTAVEMRTALAHAMRVVPPGNSAGLSRGPAALVPTAAPRTELMGSVDPSAPRQVAPLARKDH